MSQVASSAPIRPGGGAIRIEVENLRVATVAGEVDLVEEVAFRVPAGETLGLVGESGSGKTTVALALLGYARPGLEIRNGHVRVDSTDVLGLSDSELREMRGRRVAYVPQDPGSALNPSLKVGTQLSELMSAHGVGRGVAETRIAGVLEDVGLGGIRVRRRYPHQLSGGQQQRVALAMAFALEPAVIVLDEPTTGLDVTTQRRIIDTISAMCAARGVAGVFVSHDLAVLSSLVNQVAVMYAGQIVEVGDKETIFASPSHPYTQALLRAAPSLDGPTVLSGLGGQPPSPGGRPKGCGFASRCAFVRKECTAAPIPLAPSAEGGHLVRCIRAESIPRAGARAATAPTLASRTSRGHGSLLSVHDLSASYGDSEVVHDVEFELGAGECLAIVGESGSGKTTLARSVVGLHHDHRGDIRLGETRLSRTARSRSRESLRALQYIFQSPYGSLNPRKTISKILEQPVSQFFDLDREEIRSRIENALDGASLSERVLGRYPRELSGGERQRVAIARALVAEPKVLVCDEITSSLDVCVQATIVETLRRLQLERQLALLFVTHNLALVRSIAQRILVVKEGRVVESGSSDAVLAEPTHDYTRSLLRDLPTPAGREPRRFELAR